MMIIIIMIMMIMMTMMMMMMIIIIIVHWLSIINRENNKQAAAEHCHVIPPSFYEQWEACKSSDFQLRAFTFFLIRLKGQIFWKRCNWKEPSSVQSSRGIFSGVVIESGAAFWRTSSTSLVWLLMKVSPLNSDEEGFFPEERLREGGLRMLEQGRQCSLSFIPSFNHFFFM